MHHSLPESLSAWQQQIRHTLATYAPCKFPSVPPEVTYHQASAAGSRANFAMACTTSRSTSWVLDW